MLHFLTFLLASHGLVSAVTGGGVFRGFRALVAGRSRRLGELVHCPMCLGFWVGCAGAWAGVWRPETGSAVLSVVVAGLCASATCWGARVVLWRLGEDEL